MASGPTTRAHAFARPHTGLRACLHVLTCTLLRCWLCWYAQGWGHCVEGVSAQSLRAQKGAFASADACAHLGMAMRCARVCARVCAPCFLTTRAVQQRRLAVRAGGAGGLMLCGSVPHAASGLPVLVSPRWARHAHAHTHHTRARMGAPARIFHITPLAPILTYYNITHGVEQVKGQPSGRR